MWPNQVILENEKVSIDLLIRENYYCVKPIRYTTTGKIFEKNSSFHVK